MLRAMLLAAPAALALAAPAGAATIRFDFSGTTFAENQSLPRDQAYTATAVFDTDVTPITQPPFSDQIFNDALVAFEITIGGETLTANRPGRAIQDGPGGQDGASNFGFDLGARNAFDPVVDALDGSITGTDGRVYEAQTLGATLLFSFASDTFLYDDVTQLLNAVEPGTPVALPTDIRVGTFTQINFVSDGPPASLDFRIDSGSFTVVDDDGGNGGGGTPPVIPLPASGLLLLGGLAALGAWRRRG